MDETNRAKFAKFYDGLIRYTAEYYPIVAFYGYGSCFDKPHNPNPKDFDGGVIMPTLVTDKSAVQAISQKIAELAESYRISREDLQLSLLDRESARDGRFLSYTTDYSRFIVQRARDLTGNAKFEDLRETDNRFGILESTAFNFRSIRNGYLMICPLLRQNHCAGSGELVREFTRAIDKTESLPRKLACLGIYRNAGEKRYDEVIKFLASTDKTDAVKIMPEVIGEADLSFFDRLEKIRSARTPKQVISGWTQALETFEYLIQGFIQNNPPMELEVRTVL